MRDTDVGEMSGASAREAEDDEVDDGRGSLRSTIEWIAVIVGALVIALIIKTFLFQAFYIPSQSMEPTLKVGDRVLVNKISYDLHEVHRGDIVVFERPPNEPPSDINDLIKRVIAVEGDTIEGRESKVYLNGKLIDEPYLPDGMPTDNLERQEIPPDHVFVMGDNRTDSGDSRRFGPIDEDLIVGRAFVRIWPLSALGFL